jgi:phospholipid/cholesterol/gamma-HCH transport system substrate-binding protein
METKANYTFIGGAVLGLFVLAAIFAVWLSRIQFDAEYAVYDIVFPGTVRGLDRGGEVRFNGIKVGEVTNLTFDKEDVKRVVARIRVDANAPIKVDSVAQLEAVGLTGVALVQISGGGDKSALLKAQASIGNVPRLLARQAQLDALFENGESIAINANRTLSSINGVLTADNTERIARILANLEAVSASLAAERAILSDARAAINQVGGAGAQIGEAAAAINSLSANANSHVDALANNTTATLSDARTAIVSLNAAAQQAGVLAARAEQAIATANSETLPEITATAEELRRLSATFERLAQNVEDNPSQFVTGASKPTVQGVRP